ncbi:type II toxin-antitoxin system antitoxin SocA domain-containing protein [Pedobacter endophyticus]|uniref:DUF4065 domain-containing protein n=1 Tax=Pedobacter endophyticus TaxID=2789740 RepID=A0A7S9KZS6_9SPHI|nr:type II toxin-antitoxin system antitoxin SocA domain-containing protein [Pedobacter endophyticus]QPH39837.1 DUF4065 domain-containing protein [Pedobacter endophyticus]
MDFELSKQEIGRRIVLLRNRKGLSQSELSKSINISRPSLTQIELGNRSISLNELQRLSHALSFSLDDFVAKDFQLGQNIDSTKEAQPVTEERISIPTLNINKFKNVLLYILERCAGKPNVGETVLYKLLYFSDFNYYELYEEHLTGAKYKKLPYGPVPQKLDSVINQMLDDNEIQRIKTAYKGFAQKRFLPLQKADLTQLKASEKDVIDKVLEQMSDWSATAISDYSHKDLPWEVTEDGKDISYNLAFYREVPYSVRVYDEDFDH